MIDSLMHDVRYAMRTLAKSPGFAFVAITSLALGIGANSTIFSLVRATLFPTLPYAEASRLVDLHETSPELCDGCSVGTSYATYRDWKTQTRVFAGMGASREEEFVLSGTEEAVRIPGALVSFDLFPLLGVQPALGRTFSADEDRVGGPRVILLSYGIWQRLFGSDSSIVGRSVRLNGVPATVVGIMPNRFGYPEFAQMWTPMGAAITSSARDDRFVGVVGRLEPGIGVDRARSDVAAVGARLAAEHPTAFRGWTATATPVLQELRAESGPPFLVLLGASAFVLLIACANLANLMLARASRREREVAVRVALGASRGRLVRMMLAESGLVSFAGGALGVLLSLWGVDMVPRLIGTQIPFWIEFVVDWRVVVFAIVLSGFTSLAFGLVPALRASRPNLVVSLKDGAQHATGSSRRGRLRSVLVVAQIACALVLLAGAGLMMKTFARSRDTSNLGFDPRNVLTSTVHTLQPRYSDTGQIATFATAVEARVASVPGVVAMSVEHTEFLGTFVGGNSNLTLEGASTPVSDNIVPRFSRAVGVDYFRVLRIPVRRGRVFQANDRAGAPGVAVLNEAAAQTLWPNEDPIGKRVKIGPPNGDRPWLTVVGVVGSAVGSRLSRARTTGFLYLPFAQQPGRPLSLFVRTAGPPLDLAPAVRAEIRAADPDVATDPMTTMEASLSSGYGPVGFFMKLLGGLATLAVALAALGIYGVVSYTVAQRTREIGIRMALGATSRGILRLVIGYGAVMTVIGVAVGIAGSMALTRVLQGMLFGTSATDPVVFAFVSVLLAGVSIAACYGPARRAVRVEPIVAIRYE